MSCNSCNPEPKFSRIDHWGQTNVSRRLEENLKNFYQWAFVCIGAFKNIRVANGTWAILDLVDCSPGLPNQVYQSMRKDWVWEPVTYTDPVGNVISPITPQIYVNGGLQPSGNYNIDYPNGRVVFNAAPGGTVTADYSFRNVQVYCAGDVPWWRELQQLSWNVDANHFNCCENGDWTIGSHHRVQMPTVIIQATDGQNEPYCIGGCEIRRLQEVSFHVFAETDCERDNILDIILNQDERDITLYNPDDVYLNSAYPLTCQGYRQGNNTYPDLLSTYGWGCARIENSRVFGRNDLRCNLFEGQVRAELQTIFSCL